MTSQSTSRRLCNFHWCFWTVQVPWFSAFRRECVFLLLKFSQLAFSPSALLPVKESNGFSREFSIYTGMWHTVVHLSFGYSVVTFEILNGQLQKKPPSLTLSIRNFFMYVLCTTIPRCREQTYTRIFYKREKMFKKNPKNPPQILKTQRPKCAEQKKETAAFVITQLWAAFQGLPRLWQHVFSTQKCSFSELSPALMVLEPCREKGLTVPAREPASTRAQRFQAGLFSQSNSLGWERQGPETEVINRTEQEKKPIPAHGKWWFWNKIFSYKTTTLWADAASHRAWWAGLSPVMLMGNKNTWSSASGVLGNVWWNDGIWLLKVYSCVAEISVTRMEGLD